MTEEPEKPEAEQDENPESAGHMPPPPVLQYGVIVPGTDVEDYYTRKYAKLSDFLLGFSGNIIAGVVLTFIFCAFSIFLIIGMDIFVCIISFKKGRRFIGWGVIISLIAAIA
ncbi:MAG: hypothetical protein WCJ56_08075, partial [bacterium]